MHQEVERGERETDEDMARLVADLQKRMERTEVSINQSIFIWIVINHQGPAQTRLGQIWRTIVKQTKVNQTSP